MSSTKSALATARKTQSPTFEGGSDVDAFEPPGRPRRQERCLHALREANFLFQTHLVGSYLVVQPGVLDGDRGLCREQRQDLHVAFAEGIELGTLEVQHADAAVLQKERDRQLRAHIFDHLDVARIQRHVRNQDDFLVEGGVPDQTLAEPYPRDLHPLPVLHGELDLQLVVLVEEQDAQRPVIDETARELAEAREEPPLTAAGRVSAETAWERITYFLERVVPVAAEHKVRLACHPHDPGVPPEGFRGVARVLGTVEGMKRFVEIQPSPYHGLNLCLGSTAEMLQQPAIEIHDVIRHFGARGKIFNIHFRNIRGRRDSFQEVFPDEGDMDMWGVLNVLADVGYKYMVMPDHVPQIPGIESGQGFAFAFGYIKALIAAVAAES